MADMASYPWVKISAVFNQDMSNFPRVQAWLDRIAERPAVQRGVIVGKELRRPPPTPGSDEQKEAAKALFGQTAASVRPGQSATTPRLTRINLNTTDAA